MGSAHDLTARARIRDAAIALFAERGIPAATIRDIALAAGVSSGLLRHHFGSKEGLRDACDEYALAKLTGISSRLAEFGQLAPMTPEVLVLQRYLVRSLMDGSPAGAAMFDRMIEYGEQWLAGSVIKTDDPRAVIAVISAMKMSLFTMRDLLSRALGVDVDTPEGWFRVLNASLDIFSQPLVNTEQAEQARGALAAFHTPEETQRHD